MATNFDQVIDGRPRTTGYNRRLAQWRVTWLIENSTSHQICGALTVLSSEIRHSLKRQNVMGNTKKENHGYITRILR
jgi:hypothetical protein